MKNKKKRQVLFYFYSFGASRRDHRKAVLLQTVYKKKGSENRLYSGIQDLLLNVIGRWRSLHAIVYCVRRICCSSPLIDLIVM